MDVRWMRSGLVLGTLAFATAACSDDDPVDPPEPSAPTAQELLTMLEQENYQQSWQLWPVGELYEVCCGHEGDPPMVDLLTTYLNDLAISAWNNNTVAAEGATIVKEGYVENEDGDATLAVMTVMYKAEEGYNPDGADWFWAMYPIEDGQISIMEEGRIQMCIGCHQSMAAGNPDLIVGPQVDP
jgi:hypothetical protein